MVFPNGSHLTAMVNRSSPRGCKSNDRPTDLEELIGVLAPTFGNAWGLKSGGVKYVISNVCVFFFMIPLIALWDIFKNSILVMDHVLYIPGT